MSCKNCVHVHGKPDKSVVCKMHKELYQDENTVLYCTAKEVQK